MRGFQRCPDARAGGHGWGAWSVAGLMKRMTREHELAAYIAECMDIVDATIEVD